MAYDDDGKERVYRMWPAKSYILCCGLAMTGPCPFLLFLPWGMTGVPVALYCLVILPGAMIWHPVAVAPALISFTLMFISLIRLTFGDPGVLPRRALILASPPSSVSSAEHLQKVLGYNILGEGEPHRDPNRDPKDMVSEAMRKEGYRWCPTCEIIRPPRSSHCSWCDHCVLVFDHHCPFLNQCIARRNYRYFITFAVSLVASVLFGIGSALAWLTAMDLGRSSRRHARRHRTRLRGSATPAAVLTKMGSSAKNLLAGRPASAGWQPEVNKTPVLVASSSDSTPPPSAGTTIPAVPMNGTAAENALLAAESLALKLTGMQLQTAAMTISSVVGCLSLVGASLLIYHLYLLRSGKTTKEHWTQGKKPAEDKKGEDQKDVEMVPPKKASSSHAAVADVTNVAMSRLKDQTTESGAVLNDRKTKQTEESRRMVRKIAEMRRATQARRKEDFQALCSGDAPRLIEPRGLVSRQVFEMHLSLARVSVVGYAEQRAKYLQEKMNWSKERAQKASRHEYYGPACGCDCCAGSCIERAKLDCLARCRKQIRRLLRVMGQADMRIGNGKDRSVIA